MSDHTHDPLRDLKNFGTGGVPVPPLDPAQVRRLGDRRRTRRRAAIAIAASVLAVIGGIVPVTLAMTDGAGTPAPPLGTPTPMPTPMPSTTPTPTPTPTADPPAGDVGATTYTYPGFWGVEVTTAEDLDALRGAPDDFRNFVLGLVPDSLSDPECGVASGPRVYRYSTTGFAAGYSPGCFDDELVWALRDGEWVEVATSYQYWDCAELDAAGVPRSFVGGCFTGDPRRLQPAGDFGPGTVEGLRLRMTQAQVEAAGGTVRWPESPEGCGSVYLPGTAPEAGDLNGYISDRGVVALYPVTFANDGEDRRPRMSTPEGIGIGSSRAEVERAYPDGTFVAIRGAWMVPLGDRGRYRFDFADGKVAAMSLEATDQNCYE